MLVVVTGPPCSGKSTWIASHRKDGEDAFQRGGLDCDPKEVARDRAAFIAAHAASSKTAWVEACDMTPALRRSLRGVPHRVHEMGAGYGECAARLMASDRPHKRQWLAVIGSAFRG